MTVIRPARRGLSLIELLAVIGILGLLAAIAVGAFFRIIPGQKVSATEATITKIAQAVERKRNAVVDAINRGKDPVPSDILSYADNDRDRARAVWIYLRLKQEFPTSRAEATTNIGPLTGTTSVLTHRKIFDKLPTGGNQTEESAGCLWLTLMESGSGGVTQDADGLQNQTSEISVSGGTMNVFRDSWGTPIALVRLAYATELDTATYASRSASKDTNDPMGRLGVASGGWTITGAGNRRDEFWGVVTDKHLPASVPTTYPSRTTVLAVVSAGADKIFGTFFGTDDASLDNVVSFRLTSGKK